MLPPFSKVSGSAPFSKDCVTLTFFQRLIKVCTSPPFFKGFWKYFLFQGLCHISLFPKVDQGVHKSHPFSKVAQSRFHEM